MTIDTHAVNERVARKVIDAVEAIADDPQRCDAKVSLLTKEIDDENGSLPTQVSLTLHRLADAGYIRHLSTASTGGGIFRIPPDFDADDIDL